MLATQQLGSEQKDSQTLQEVVYQTIINLYLINIFYKEYLNMSYQKVFLSSIFEHSFLHSFLYCQIEQTSKNSTLSHSLCIKHHHYGFLSNPRTSYNNLSQSMFSLISSKLISEQCLPTEVTICICNPNSKIIYDDLLHNYQSSIRPISNFIVLPTNSQIGSDALSAD